MFDYTYGTGTEFGQIKTLARTLPNSGGTTWTTTTQTFTHDVIGQLKQSAETGLPTRTYTYDLAGNRKTKSEGGVSTSYGPANTVNQITSATGGTDAYSNATSDANGNLIQIVYSDGSRRVMTWDSINRLKRIEIRAGVNPANGDKATDFTYNGLSQRTQNTNWTHDGMYWASVTYDWFVWGDGEIVQKRAGNTQFINGTNYYAEGESRHTGTSSTKHYYTRDHLGTVYEMTNWGGAAQAAYTYGPYGDRSKRYGSYEAEKAYTGHWVYKPSTATHAAAKQLYLTWYRVYDPQAGRWLSRDPLGLDRWIMRGGPAVIHNWIRVDVWKDGQVVGQKDLRFMPLPGNDWDILEPAETPGPIISRTTIKSDQIADEMLLKFWNSLKDAPEDCAVEWSPIVNCWWAVADYWDVGMPTTIRVLDGHNIVFGAMGVALREIKTISYITCEHKGFWYFIICPPGRRPSGPEARFAVQLRQTALQLFRSRRLPSQ